MSATAHQKLAVVVAGAVAVGLLGVVAVRDRSSESEAPAAPTGTVATTPSKAIDVVDLTTPEQATIAVSSRLFASADMAVLTDQDSKADAIAAAIRLQVPILLDDPATPAELTRLRASTVLTFGTVSNVFGAVPAESDPAVLDNQIAELQATQPAAIPQDGAASVVDAVVLMKSAKTFDIAAASVKVSGATVVQTTQGDLRKDSTTAAALAARPDSSVIALGSPFTEAFSYSLAAVQQEATQIGGGYFALPGRRFVGLHGKIGDPTSGMLGQQNTAASIKLIKTAAAKFAANDSGPIVPMFEIVATSASATPGKDKNYSDEVSPADLEPVIDAAEKAGLYVLIDLQPGTSTFLTQAKAYEDLLARKNVGLTLEPAYRVEGDTDPTDATGGVSAGEINQVANWLADLTARNSLPQKLLVVRELSPATILGRADIDTSRPELSVVLGVDVAGSPSTKLAAWKTARSGAPQGASFGWMQFKSKDKPLFTVNQTYKRIKPYPSVITYQ